LPNNQKNLKKYCLISLPKALFILYTEKYGSMQGVQLYRFFHNLVTGFTIFLPAVNAHYL